MERTRKNPTKAEIATSYHEAGHAVSALWLGIAIGTVSVEPDESEGSLGHVVTKTPAWIQPDAELSLKAKDWIQRRIQVALAGRIAERLFTGRWNRVGAASDFHTAVDLADYCCGSNEEVGAFIKWLDLKARGLVSWHRSEIEKVADVLLQRRQLRSRDVKVISRTAFDEAMRQAKAAHRRNRSEQ